MPENNANEPGAPKQSASTAGGRPGTRQRRIGERLVEACLITERQLNEALRLQASQGGRTVEILVSLGYLDPAAFTRFLARQPGIPSINLQHYEVARETLTLVPRKFAVDNEVFPLDRMGNLLTLAMACPLDTETIQKLETQTGLRVKPVLCAPGDVRQAINRYYRGEPSSENTGEQGAPESSAEDTVKALAGVMRLSSVAHMIRQIQYLPGLPDTVRRVKEAMGDSEISVKEIAEVLSADPALAAKVLSVANSAAYGFHQRVAEVGHAVSLLGLRETYSIVVAAKVIDMFDDKKNFEYRSFWRTSLDCAAAALAFAKASPIVKRASGVFTAGLLHDIGRIALAEVAPERYARVESALRGDALLDAEHEVMGLTHAEAGHELARHWELPPEIASAIRFHHTPEEAEEGKVLATLTALASVAANADNEGIALTDELFAGQESRLELLGIDSSELKSILSEYCEQKDALSVFGFAA